MNQNVLKNFPISANISVEEVGRGGAWGQSPVFKLWKDLLPRMDLSPFRQNFEKNRNRQKYHHSLKEHPTFTKIAKFGCEML